MRDMGCHCCKKNNQIDHVESRGKKLVRYLGIWVEIWLNLMTKIQQYVPG